MELFITGIILTVSLMLALLLFELVIGERLGIDDLHEYTELTVPERRKMFIWVLFIAILMTLAATMFTRNIMLDDYYSDLATMNTKYTTYIEAMNNENLSRLDKFELLKQLDDYNDQVLNLRKELRTNMIWTNKELKAMANDLNLIGGTK